MQSTNQHRTGAIWGILLILAGVVFLLQNMGFAIDIGPLLAMALFGVGSAVFLLTFLTDLKGRWWAAIPGTTLLGLAATIYYSTYAPSFLSPLAGSVFLASIGAGFILVYIVDVEKWWAIIPAGVLTTLAVVAGIDEIRFLNIDTGGIFFIGLGGTFLLVALLSGVRGERQSWALIPAAVLLIMGVLIGTPWIGYMENVWPIALIAAGAIWIFRSTSSKQDPLPPSQLSDEQETYLEQR
ncbi:MAG: hypothetical protein KDE19_01105 [Caldilineaceae bacterium]|nr:hypothetical protein [Caldilineaceae bacterium]